MEIPADKEFWRKRKKNLIVQNIIKQKRLKQTEFFFGKQKMLHVSFEMIFQILGKRRKVNKTNVSRIWLSLKRTRPERTLFLACFFF